MKTKKVFSTDLSLTIKHQLMTRPASSPAGNEAAELIHQIQGQYADLVEKVHIVSDDLLRIEPERRAVKTKLVNDWMAVWAGRFDKQKAKIVDTLDRDERHLESVLQETSSLDQANGFETRSFLRSEKPENRGFIALKNPKFAKAVAAQPAELSGMDADSYAQCVELAKETASRFRYADAKDLRHVAALFDDLGQAMLRQTREILDDNRPLPPNWSTVDQNGNIVTSG